MFPQLTAKLGTGRHGAIALQRVEVELKQEKEM